LFQILFCRPRRGDASGRKGKMVGNGVAGELMVKPEAEVSRDPRDPSGPSLSISLPHQKPIAQNGALSPQSPPLHSDDKGILWSPERRDRDSGGRIDLEFQH